MLWGVITVLLLRHDVYGLDEGAARALLISWSMADQVASSIFHTGMPDLRTLLYVPIGYLWTGNVFAAKILAVLLLAVAAWLLFGWRNRTSGLEAALLPTGLLLISPLAIEQIDTLSPGIMLLAAFALGALADVQFRANPRPFNGWFFTQLLLCAFSVSLHPAGLAYPLALIFSLRSGPLAPKYQRYFLGGIVFAVLFFMVPKFLFSLRVLWNDLTWFQNPVKSLGSIFTGSLPDDAQTAMLWVPGGLVLALTVAIIFIKRREIIADLTGRTLLIGSLIGAAVGDQAWAMIALCIFLYFGLPILLRSEQAAPGSGFFKQRGWVLLIVFIFATVFMQGDKAYHELGRSGTLSAQDQLIKTLAIAAENDRAARDAEEGDKKRPMLIVASEWPGRTMLACKCNTLPLPPVARDAQGQPDPQTQLAKLRGVTYLLLDPRQTANVDLARNLALLGGIVETASLQPGGVILHVKDEPAPKADTPKTDGKNSL
ncbi:MAG TPA: hypothetical protein VIU46_01480 [Gallionellaceae bacterium]